MKKRKHDEAGGTTLLKETNNDLKRKLIESTRKNKELTQRLNNLQGFQSINPMLYKRDVDGERENLYQANEYLHRQLKRIEQGGLAFHLKEKHVEETGTLMLQIEDLKRKEEQHLKMIRKLMMENHALQGLVDSFQGMVEIME